METTAPQIRRLFAALKHELKARGRTYRELADALGTSEASVKRWFSQERLTLEQLAAIAEFLGLTLAELTQDTGEPPLHCLTLEQEKNLLANAQRLVIAVCVLNHWTLADIVEKYAISEPQCIKALVELDRLRLIDLLPENRVRLRVARDFDWLPNGPIHQFFHRQSLRDFLDNPFNDNHATSSFTHGMLTPAANAQFQKQLRKLRQSFAELHQESLAAPMAQRYGTGLFFALREWEPKEFAALRRHEKTPAVSR